MAGLEMDVLKDIPGYKVILKAVIRTQIQQLVEQLADYTDEESVILTASAADGTISHLGSDYGRLYLDMYEDVKKSFLGFCLQKNPGLDHDSRDRSITPNRSTTPTLPSQANITKIQSNVVQKSRHSPYTGRPSSTEPKTGNTSKVSKNRSGKKNNGESAGQSKTENEKSKSAEFMEVTIKEEPIDNSYENSRTSASAEGASEQKDANGIVRNTQSSDSLKSNVNETLDSVSTSMLTSSMSDPTLNTSQALADNSDMMPELTPHTNLTQEIQGQSPNTVQSDIPVFFSSSRGGTKMYLDGFVYNEDRSCGIRLYWRCAKRQCKGRLITTKLDGTVVRRTPHTIHEANYSDVQVRKVIDKNSSWMCVPNYVNEKGDQAVKNKTLSKNKAAVVPNAVEAMSSDIKVNDGEPKLKDGQVKIPSVDADTSDTEIYDDTCSQDDSIKDYLSEEENKENATSSDTDVDVTGTDDKNKILELQTGGSGIKRLIEMSAENVDIMQICHETIDTMAKCVARAISEERNQTTGNNQDKNPSTLRIESSASYEDVKLETDPSQGVQKDSELDQKDMHEKARKVLAFWNEITSDVNEARSEVLYDIITDQLKQELKKQTSLDKTEEKSQDNYKAEALLITKGLSQNPSVKDDTQNINRSGTQSINTKESLNPPASLTSSDKTSSLSTTMSDKQKPISKDVEKHVGVTVGKTAVSVHIASNVIDLEAASNKKTSSQSIKTSERTPVKQTENRQTENTPKHQRTTPIGRNKNQQKQVGQVTPKKQNKNFIDNLISKGVPIIIPDDDDDTVHDKQEVIPTARSSAFETKSSQYHNEMDMNSRQMSNMAKMQQRYAAHMQQSQYMSKSMQSSPSYKQQYSPQMMQQFQYQDYYSQQQYTGKYPQTEDHDFTPPKQAMPSRQQLFTPPKNVSPAPRMRDVSPTAAQSRQHLSPHGQHASQSSLQTPPKSQYFQQGYTTPTKQQEMMQGSLYRRQIAQTSFQSPTHEQRPSVSPRTKQNIAAETMIVIDDDQSFHTRKQPPAFVKQNPAQMQPRMTKAPIMRQNVQNFQTAVPRPLAQNVSLEPTMPQLVQAEQTQLINTASSDEKSAQNTMKLPVISCVASVSAEKSDHNTIAQMELMQELKQTFPAADIEQSVMNQSNDKTSMKRTRSEDTMTHNVHPNEPTSKRRHTSADEYRVLAANTRLTPSPNPQSFQENHGQISPSKIKPKLEIDIDDVPEVLPEPSNQIAGLNSSPVPSPVDRKSNDDGRPVIPISTQLVKPDLVSFSPPVSPSTRRLHAGPATRSKTPVDVPSSLPAPETEVPTAPPQENAPQTKKIFGCGDCGKSYTTKAALNQHFRKHTQERPFECDVCGKHYSQKGYLKKHILTHFKSQEK